MLAVYMMEPPKAIRTPPITAQATVHTIHDNANLNALDQNTKNRRGLYYVWSNEYNIC